MVDNFCIHLQNYQVNIKIIDKATLTNKCYVGDATSEIDGMTRKKCDGITR